MGGAGRAEGAAGHCLTLQCAASQGGPMSAHNGTAYECAASQRGLSVAVLSSGSSGARRRHYTEFVRECVEPIFGGTLGRQQPAVFLIGVLLPAASASIRTWRPDFSFSRASSSERNYSFGARSAVLGDGGSILLSLVVELASCLNSWFLIVRVRI